MDVQRSEGSANIPQFDDFSLLTCTFFGEYAKNVCVNSSGFATYILGAVLNLQSQLLITKDFNMVAITIAGKPVFCYEFFKNDPVKELFKALPVLSR
jgi:hypothetical protein